MTAERLDMPESFRQTISRRRREDANTELCDAPADKTRVEVPDHPEAFEVR